LGVRLLLALLLTILAPALASAAIPDELSRDPLERGALIALPGVYQLEARFAVTGLTTRFEGAEPLDLDGPVTVVGSAFGVATGGWVLTADHLVNGSSATLAVAALSADPGAQERLGTDDPEEWVEQAGARPAEASLLGIELRHIASDPGEAPIAAVLERREAEADLALLRTDRPDAPALELDDSQTMGTPVATIGFGADGGAGGRFAEPTIRSGALAGTGTIAGRGSRLFTQVTSPVSRGDSGGPAVDADGDVRGMVFTRARVGGNLVPGPQIREFVGAERLEMASGAHDSYREGLARFWALDFEASAAAMDRALEAYPQHPLAEGLAARATELRGAQLAIRGPDSVESFLRALAVVSAMLSLGLAALLVRHDMRRRPLVESTATTIDEDGS
jgi:S1-C subfamily serine protease